MIEARGFAAQEPKTPLTPFTFKRRPVGPNDVLINIKYCGICHSDIHSVRNEWKRNGKYPMVPGHEITGTVAHVGDKVALVKIGDAVGVGCFVDSCRTCAECKSDLNHFCDKMVVTYNSKLPDGTVTYGGYSNCIVVDENYMLRIPKNLPLDAAAPLLCAGITMYSPLRHWNAGPCKQVAILGLGGLGHIGVRLARAMGTEVTVISHRL